MKTLFLSIAVVCGGSLGLSHMAAQDISNPENPYDYVGQNHNLGMSYVFESIGEEEIGHRDLSQIGASITSFLQTTKAWNGNEWNPSNSWVSYYGELKGFTANAMTDLENRGWSSTSRSYLQDLIEIGEGLNDLENEVETIISNVKVLEAEILRADIPDNERFGLLCATSTFRFSASYWASFLTGDLLYSEWSGPPSPAQRTYVSQVLIVDAVSAVYGFVSSLGNPIGAIAGGILGSMIQTLNIYWNN